MIIKPLIEPTLCPLCRSPLEEVSATTFDAFARGGFITIGRDLPVKARETVIAACTGCEFIVDLKRSDGSHKTSAQLLSEVGRWLN